MSYILDALKRADTERERERGNVPGLHSQNLPSGNLQRDARRHPPRQARYLAWTALSVLAFVAAWAFWPAAERQPDNVTTTARMPDPVPATAAQPAAGASVAPTAEPSSPPTAATPDLPILAPQPPPPPPPPARPQRTERPRAGRDTEPAAEASAQAVAPAPAAAAPLNGSAVDSPPAAPVRRFAELSPEFRAQLPQVSVSGSTYSSNPKLRTLIANGKVIQEGDEIASGLVVESIGQRTAVLNFKGTRYSIGF